MHISKVYAAAEIYASPGDVNVFSGAVNLGRVIAFVPKITDIEHHLSCIIRSFWNANVCGNAVN